MTKKWQNLLEKKCPNCGHDLLDRKQYFECPEPNPENKYGACFFIKKTEAAANLLDPNHPASRFMPEEGKAKIKELCLLNPTT